jgi:glutamyl/glutaminyl-tRNA synthetase
VSEIRTAQLVTAMQRWRFLEDPAPDAAIRWIETFLDAYGEKLHSVDDAHPLVAALRAESCVIPALELERLRTRQVLFFLDAVAQYVDHQPELRVLPLAHDLPAIGEEFGVASSDALAAVRMALTGQREGPPLELLFPLLGHDRILMRIGAVSSRLLHGRGLEPIKYGPGGAPFEPIQSQNPDET